MDATVSVAEDDPVGRRSAAVTVHVSEAEEPQVLMAEPLPETAWVPEATAGAWHALRAWSVRPLRVEIVRIVADPDTNVGDVHEATARAVWKAAAADCVYVGFTEPELVRAWLETRRGQKLRTVTEARHWHGDRSSALLHVWLQFDRGMPTRLHCRGDTLFLHPEPRYESYDMAEFGETRVGPVGPDSVLATMVGRRLISGDPIVQPWTPVESSSGLVLRAEGAQVVIAASADEWAISN